MAFERPDLPRLRERIWSDLVSRLELAGGTLRRSVVGVLATVFAGVSHLLHGHLDWASRQILPDTADEEHLQRWADIWGVRRKSAEKATGAVVFMGDPTAVIPAGTLMKRGDAVRFVTVADGFPTVTVEAVDPGWSGNTPSGSMLTLITPISGVASSGVVSAAGLVNGSDEETDDALRSRLLDRIQAPPMGGSENDYKHWALEVPGVTRAWIYPLWQGVGTVGVTFVRDGDNTIFPDAVEVAAVADYLESVRPVTAEVYVFAPAPVPVVVTMTLSPDTEAVRGAVTEALEEFFTQEAAPGATIYRSRISESVSKVIGEHHHQLVAPEADVTFAPNEMAILGAVTFQ